MNVIGYGLRGYRNGRADIHSPLHPRTFDQPDVRQLNVEQGLQALLDRGASKRKLVLGVAFFGLVYRLAVPENTTLHAPIDFFKWPEKGAFLKSKTINAYFEV
ncbi:endochitinase-like [Dermacentor silvarum]|uniref:endochitinase-like n=1 Tax=Dermacentor silvarum TaxID=543639 RepID=UPI0021014F28|nr:endochitinase-like [Dermacentor silvarum]